MISAAACPQNGHLIVVSSLTVFSDMDKSQIKQNRTDYETQPVKEPHESRNAVTIPNDHPTAAGQSNGRHVKNSGRCRAANRAMPVSQEVPRPRKARAKGNAQQAASPKAAPLPLIVSNAETGRGSQYRPVCWRKCHIPNLGGWEPRVARTRLGPNSAQ